MKWFRVSDIVNDVVVLLDAQLSGGESLFDDDTMPLSERIALRVEDAALSVVQDAPLFMLSRGENVDDVSVAWFDERGKGGGYIMLPDDFLRLIVFKMSDWHRVVSGNEVISPDHPLYLQQQSLFLGVKGNPQKPIVALVPHATGRVLEFYSCTGGESVVVDEIRYFQMPKVKDGSLRFPNRLYPSLKYLLASMISAELGFPLVDYFLGLSKLYKL